MDHYLDAKFHYEALQEVIDPSRLSHNFCNAFSSLLERYPNLKREFEQFFEQGDAVCEDTLAMGEYLLIEDCALAIADYLLCSLPIREFEKVILMEDIRRKLLPPFIERNESLKERLYEKGACQLRRHTPKNL